MTSEPGASPFGDLTRRDALRKAAVGAGVAGAAWAAPQILSLDAAAAQSCVPGTLDWDSFSTGATFTSTVINGITVTLSISALAGTTLAPLNGTIRAAPNGGINQKGLYLGMDSSGPGVGEDVTFTFSVPVSNISFTLTDLDNLIGGANTGWADRVQVLTPGYTSSIPVTFTPAAPAGNVIGAGTGANPFRNSNTNFNYPNTSNRGNVTINYAGPISSFSYRYYQSPTDDDGSSLMLITMMDLSWTC